MTLSDFNPVLARSYSIDFEGEMRVAEERSIGIMEDVVSRVVAFDAYYAGALKRSGWADTVTLNGTEYRVAPAEEPKKSIWGFVKIGGGFIRAVMFQADVTSPSPSCPCDLRLTVFESIATSLDDVGLPSP